MSNNNEKDAKQELPMVKNERPQGRREKAFVMISAQIQSRPPQNQW